MEQSSPLLSIAHPRHPDRPDPAARLRWGLGVLLFLIPLHWFLLFAAGSARDTVKYWKEALVLALVLYAVTYARSHFFLFLRRTLAFTWPFVVVVLARAAIGYLSGDDAYVIGLGTYTYLFFLPLVAIGALSLAGQSATRPLAGACLILTAIACATVADWLTELNAAVDFGRDASASGLAVNAYVGTGYRAYLGADSPIELGFVCGMGAVMALFLAIQRAGSARHKLLALTACAVCWAGTLATLSRGPLVATGLASMIVLTMTRTGFRVRGLVRLGTAAALLALCIGLAIGTVERWRRFEWGRHFASILDWQADGANIIRRERWNVAIDQIVAAPMLGHGVGSMQGRAIAYRNEQLGDADASTESQFLDLLGEGGIPLLVAFVYMAFALGRLTIRAACATNETDGRAFAVLILALFVLVYVQLAIAPLFGTRSLNVAFWLLSGAALYLELRAQPLVVSVRRPIQRMRTTWIEQPLIETRRRWLHRGAATQVHDRSHRAAVAVR